jgi:hypothetical protein
MRKTKLLISAAALLVTFALPLSASAQFLTGISFGGRVLTVIPCTGGMLHVTIAPAGVFPAAYIWTPATITNLVGPPVPGGQILGIADVPFVCFVGVGFFSSGIPLFGLRMQYIGTSPPSLGGFLGV